MDYFINIQQSICSLKDGDNYRQLKNLVTEGKYVTFEGKKMLNLSSNDYLGLGDGSLQQEFFDGLDLSKFLLSNPSSRLMTGNSPEYRALEDTIAGLFPGKQALALSCGYMINSGVLPALCSSEDVILADKLVHASIIDGLRLSTAKFERFRHNDLNHLENLLKKHSSCKGQVWVVTEDVFSMDGDRAPLAEIMALKDKYGFRLYLDAAHSFGVELLGEKTKDVDVVVATLGKAISSSGGFVVCSELEREMLINHMRTLIFSTASAPINLMWSKFLLDRMDGFAPRRAHLNKLVGMFKGAETHILPIIMGENAQAINKSQELMEQGFYVTPIRYPTVAKGSARLRISLSASLDEKDVTNFLQILKKATNI